MTEETSGEVFDLTADIVHKDTIAPATITWQEDYGYKPNFKIPLCIDSGENKNCTLEQFKEWADRQTFYRYILLLREGTTEMNARISLDDKILRTLEHGRVYTWEELGKPGMKGKAQFIVEKAF